MQTYLAELPGALALAVLTAVVTLLLAILLSAVLGSENREHRDAQRCVASMVHDMLVELGAEPRPSINIEGLDCGILYVPVTNGD